MMDCGAEEPFGESEPLPCQLPQLRPCPRPFSSATLANKGFSSSFSRRASNRSKHPGLSPREEGARPEVVAASRDMASLALFDAY